MMTFIQHVAFEVIRRLFLKTDHLKGDIISCAFTVQVISGEFECFLVVSHCFRFISPKIGDKLYLSLFLK